MRSLIIRSVPLLLILIVVWVTPLSAQADPDEYPTDDSVLVDTVEIDVDTTAISDSAFIPIGSQDDYEIPTQTPVGFFATRNGGFLGLTASFTSLSPSALDPILAGDMVVIGGVGYVVFSGWMLGGAGLSATLYDLNTAYNEFTFGYGGLLFGYDALMFNRYLSFDATLLTGFGGLDMVKNRPDLQSPDGNEILERYRKEDFFLFRPEISIGFQPIPLIELRLNAGYLLPIGGGSVSDLRSFTYGVAVILGVTY